MRGPVIPPFYAGEIGRRGSVRQRAGLPLISMNFGQPTEGAPPAAIEVAHARLDQDALGYFESEPLRERLAQLYRERYGLDIEPHRILLTGGASAGLVAAFSALFRPGDRVALVKPGYPAYRNTLRAMGLEPVEIRCGEAESYRPSVQMLAALSPKPDGFILASPANPTGAMLSADALAELVLYCRDHDICLISDEIYHGICFTGEAVSALQFDPNVIVINSFSKLYRMPGWRLGWMVAPSEWAEPMANYLINMFLTPPTLSQHAALAAMEDQQELQLSVETYRDNRDRLMSGLAELGIDRIAPPDGAFYLYADMGYLTNDSMAFCIRAVEEIGVALAPGIDFDPENGHRFVRFSFAVSPAEIQQALDLLSAWLPRYHQTAS
jgi:aspartate/methionine/tyrosine aminotransferase